MLWCIDYIRTLCKHYLSMNQAVRRLRVLRTLHRKYVSHYVSWHSSTALDN